MIHPVDSSNIIVMLVVDVALLFFLIRTWQLRKFNGIIKMVRELTFWWVLAFLIRHNVSLILRLEVASKVNIMTPFYDWLSFISNIFIAMATLYGAYLFYAVSKKHLEK